MARFNEQELSRNASNYISQLHADLRNRDRRARVDRESGIQGSQNRTTSGSLTAMPNRGTRERGEGVK